MSLDAERRYRADHGNQSNLDALVDSLVGLLAREPISVGVAAGLLVGGIANDGLVFFATTIVVWIFGLRLQNSHVRH